MATLHVRVFVTAVTLANLTALGCVAEPDFGEFEEPVGFEDLEAEPSGIAANVAPFDGLGPGLVQAPIPPLSHDGIGAFRMEQCGISHYKNDDPIVAPNQPGAAHSHMFFGNSSANAWTKQWKLEQATTTCPGGIRNLSAYWIPEMLGPNGERKKPETIRVYYKGGYGVPQDEIEAPPPGLRMIAGFNLREGKNRGAQWRGCALDNGNRQDMLGCEKGEKLELWLRFPQCWDGHSLDSPDHMSHVVYPTGGGCPESHPVPIPRVSFVVVWEVDTANTKHWRLSSDMPSDYGGQSVHGDWWNAWAPETMEALVEGCIRGKRDCNNGNLGNGWQLVFP